MAQFDLPLDQLRTYSPDVQHPDDLVPFWASTVAQARATTDGPVLTRVDTGLSEVVVDDVTFPGFGGHPIKAWLVRPTRAAGEPLPAVVELLGYGGGRGLPHEHLRWAAAGFAHLVMDTRGQGGHWGGGETPDPVGRSAGAMGVVTAGIDDPHDHYYRRFYTDGVRAVDAIRQVPGIDPARVAVAGTSQGGGGCIAVAALLAMAATSTGRADDVAAAMPDVPFLIHFRRAVEIVDSHPYGEITRYLSVRRDPAVEATAWHTLSYLDGANLARHATAPALFSVALMDQTCPPSTVFAAYNAWGAASGTDIPKRIDVYPYNDHEGGQAYRFPAQLTWLRGDSAHP